MYGVILLAVMTPLSADMQPLVVGGENANSGAWPWMAALHRKTVAGEVFNCGGALIAPDWVLTAAHCVSTEEQALPADRFRVSVGGVRRDGSDATFRQVVQILVHPQYRRQGLQNDMALLRLSAPLSQPPVALAAAPEFASLSVETPLTVLGWGRTTDGTLADRLQQAQLGWLPNWLCVGWWAALSDSQLCGVDHNHKVDTCAGDSGGPMLVSRNGQAWLMAVTSYGSADCDARVPGVYGLVPAYLDWIEHSLGAATVGLDLALQHLHAGVTRPAHGAHQLNVSLSNLSAQHQAADSGVRFNASEALRIESLAGWYCDGPSTSVTCWAGDIAAGDSRAADFLVHQTGQGAARVAVTAEPVTAGHNYRAAISGSLTLLFSDLPDVSMSLSWQASAGGGQDAQLDIQLENRSGAGWAEQVMVSINKPDGVTLVALGDTRCEMASTLRCYVGDLPAGESRRLALRVEGAAPGQLLSLLVAPGNGNFPADRARAWLDTGSGVQMISPRNHAQGDTSSSAAGLATWLLLLLMSLVPARGYARRGPCVSSSTS